MFRLTVYRVHAQLAQAGWVMRTSMGDGSASSRRWLARRKHSKRVEQWCWCCGCGGLFWVPSLDFTSVVRQHPMTPERWIAVAAVIVIATAMALLFVGWEHQYAR
jgi:hypothetical protein